MEKQWFAGWGEGLTGPTTPTSTPFCGGAKWPYMPVSQGMSTIAVVPAQDGSTGIVAMENHARLIAAAPDLLEALLEAGPYVPEHHGPVQARIKAAIKKATEE